MFLICLIHLLLFLGNLQKIIHIYKMFPFSSSETSKRVRDGVQFFFFPSILFEVKLDVVLSHFGHVQLSNPMDYSPPGSSVHGILQARILEYVAMSSSREYF